MTLALEPPLTLTPNRAFAAPAAVEMIERVANALRARGYDVHVAPDRETARRVILDLIPEGAEVGQGASKTLEELGVTSEIERSGRYDAIRPRWRAMDRKTQAREIRKLMGAPDFWLNSAQAITEDGTIVVASNTGSQLGPIASGAGRVIFAIGAQKIVSDLEAAFRRIHEYSYPLEDARMQASYGVHSVLRKILVLDGEARPGRASVVLVTEPVGD